MNAAIGSPERPHRVAIVGAGPSGFYAAEALLKVEDHDARVDIYERLPAPFGLVRYGVAPDHQKIKSVTRLYDRVLEDERVRFYGNVTIGDGVTIADLLERYDDVVLTVGASSDKRLGIPGEDLRGSWSATEFVGWYNGDPAFQDRAFSLDRVRTAVVVGVGNVALDVARILARGVEDLEPTDITARAIAALRSSGVRDIYLLGRRGPAQVKFSPSELKELASLEGVSVQVTPRDLELDPVSASWLDRQVDHGPARNMELMAGLSGSAPDGRRTIHLRFCVSPVEIQGDDDGRVRGVVLERNVIQAGADGEPRPRGSGELETLACEAVFRSVGYRGVALPGVPFDATTGVIPNEEGRVLDASRRPVRGLYVAGWIKRGPTGLIGTNKADAIETVQALLADAWGNTGEADPEWAARTDAWVRERVPDVFDQGRWSALDGLEVERGEAAGKVREKITSVAEMLELASDELE